MPSGNPDFLVVGVTVTGRGVAVVDGKTVKTGAGTGVGDDVVVGSVSTILNVAEPLTSWVMPFTVTIYSSGLKPVESTLNDQKFCPLVPC